MAETLNYIMFLLFAIKRNLKDKKPGVNFLFKARAGIFNKRSLKFKAKTFYHFNSKAIEKDLIMGTN